MKAEEKETITLEEQEGTVITPEPDVQAEPIENTAEDDSMVQAGAESAQAEADAADEVPEKDETTQSEPVTEAEASAAEDAGEPGEDSEVWLQDDEDTEIEEEKKTGKGRLSAVFGVIGGLILAAAAAVSVLLWRKKNPKQ